MKKKIAGFSLLAFAIYLLITVISFEYFIKLDTIAQTALLHAICFFPFVYYSLYGIFLITFDNAEKKDYIQGFKKRRGQTIVSFILLAINTYFLTSSVSNNVSSSNPIVTAFVLLAYFVPLLYSILLVSVYAVPYWSCRKTIRKHKDALNEYLADKDAFHAITDDNAVLASDKALFFPKIFCVIPFDQIASVKLVNMFGEPDVYFMLTDGKKCIIITKHFESIKKAIDDNANAQKAEGL